MKCDFCGTTNANVSQYKFSGLINDQPETVLCKICDCCSAWGVTSNEEFITSLTGFDSMIDVTEVVDYMVDVGTKNTTTGNYIFYFDELSRKLGYDVSRIANHIFDKLCDREEVICDDQTLTDDSFNIIFGLKYCPNVEEDL